MLRRSVRKSVRTEYLLHDGLAGRGGAGHFNNQRTVIYDCNGELVHDGREWAILVW